MKNEVEGKNSGDISKLLRGQSGSSLNVTIKRPNVAEPMVKEIVRETYKNQ